MADAKLPIFDLASKNYDFLHQIFRSKYLQKNDQNSVFVSEAVHSEIIIWNNQIFEEGYMSHPKYLGPTVWINIQLVPKPFTKYYWILLCLLLFMTQMVKYTMQVKVIKYLSSEIMELEKKWGARYTFWYIVLLTLFNGDRRIVQWMVEKKNQIECGMWKFLAISGYFWQFLAIFGCIWLFLVDFKRSIDLRWLFDPVLLFILDDFIELESTSTSKFATK